MGGPRPPKHSSSCPWTCLWTTSWRGTSRRRMSKDFQYSQLASVKQTPGTSVQTCRIPTMWPYGTIQAIRMLLRSVKQEQTRGYIGGMRIRGLKHSYRDECANVHLLASTYDSTHKNAWM